MVAEHEDRMPSGYSFHARKRLPAGLPESFSNCSFCDRQRMTTVSMIQLGMFRNGGKDRLRRATYPEVRFGEKVWGGNPITGWGLLYAGSCYLQVSKCTETPRFIE